MAATAGAEVQLAVLRDRTGSTAPAAGPRSDTGQQVRELALSPIAASTCFLL
jgi:hypothetical protein